jgi:O-antigen ligase
MTAPVFSRDWFRLERLLAALIGAGLIAATAVLPVSLAVGLVGAFVLLILSLRWPFAGLVAVLVSIPLSTPFSLRLGEISIGPAEVVLPIYALAWLFRLGAGEASLRLPGVFWPALAFTGTLLWALPAAESVPLALKEVAKWVLFTLAMVAGASAGLSERQRTWFVRVLLGLTLIEGVLGLMQSVFRLGPLGFIFGETLRAYGTFGQPNPYAGYLTMGIVAAYVWMRHSLRRGALGDLGLGLLAAGAGGLGELLSLSRAAWLGLLAGLGVTSLAGRRTIIGLLVLLAAGILVGLPALAYGLVPAEVTERLAPLSAYFSLPDPRYEPTRPDNYAILERMAYWYAAWFMFVDSPLRGVGPGNFGVVYQRFAVRGWETVPGVATHAHNYYLNVLAETGVSGLTVHLGLLVGLVAAGVRAIRRDPEDPLGWVVAGWVVAVATHNIFDNMFVAGFPTQLGLTLGIAVAGRERPENSR